MALFSVSQASFIWLRDNGCETILLEWIPAAVSLFINNLDDGVGEAKTEF
jgi:hypothetical protein